MAAPARRERGEVVNLILPRLDDVERNVRVLTAPADRSALRRQSAAYDLLTILKDTAELGAQWAQHLYPAHPTAGAQVPISLVGEKVADTLFLFRLGDRIDGGLRRQGICWPPPQANPPPAITRDLIELYETARARSPLHSTDGGVDLAETFRVISTKSTQLIGILEDAHRTVGVISRTRRATARSNRGASARLSSILGGLALGIGLIQGPGAIHDLPQDVRDLGGDVRSLARTIATGVSELAEQVARELSDDLL